MSASHRDRPNADGLRESGRPDRAQPGANEAHGEEDGWDDRGARPYLWTFGALLVLTTLTLGLTFLDLGAAGPASALGIAFVKAMLVALFFMHLIEHRTSSWLTLVVAALLAGTLVTLAVLDVATRTG